ncbi:MAG TPA: methylated-DNA--[protein]-cysteine S-methyltransferase [Vicinamibacterales bacterium]|jgi:methylated-DNA-[protein]-cysteine S-methyltransferase
MSLQGYSLFDTPIGRCGIAWTDRGVASVLLPDATDAALRAHLARRFPQARETTPPHDVRQAIDAIAALLSGEPTDLSFVKLDMNGVPEFNQRVYRAARLIRPGSTASYGDIARQLGVPGSARAVGQALGRNPFPIIVPCHRVLAADGKTGGFSAPGGTATKLRLLAVEGARLL